MTNTFSANSINLTNKTIDNNNIHQQKRMPKPELKSSLEVMIEDKIMIGSNIKRGDTPDNYPSYGNV